LARCNALLLDLTLALHFTGDAQKAGFQMSVLASEKSPLSLPLLKQSHVIKKSRLFGATAADVLFMGTEPAFPFRSQLIHSKGGPDIRKFGSHYGPRVDTEAATGPDLGCKKDVVHEKDCLRGPLWPLRSPLPAFSTGKDLCLFKTMSSGEAL